MSVTIKNLERRRIMIETNTHIEIRGPNPPMPNATGVEYLAQGDELVVDTEREVRIELRGDAIAVLV